ncbi:MAG: hypothetical protein ACPG4Y_02615 [Chitinophagales bacterium]
MKAYGILKKRLKNNRFATPIFTEKNTFFIQSSSNGFNSKFKEVNIKEEEIKKIDFNKEFDKGLSEKILCFYEKNNTKIGIKDDLFKHLLEKLDEINDIVVKVKISEELNLNGKMEKYKTKRDVFFKEKNIDIKFPNNDNFLTIAGIEESSKPLLDKTIENYSLKIHNSTIDLEWDDVLLTNTSEKDDFIIDKFRFNLSNVFDVIQTNKKNKDLCCYLINKHNSEISFNIENSYINENIENKSLNNFNNIKEFIKSKNNG